MEIGLGITIRRITEIIILLTIIPEIKIRKIQKNEINKHM